MTNANKTTAPFDFDTFLDECEAEEEAFYNKIAKEVADDARYNKAHSKYIYEEGVA